MKNLMHRVAGFGLATAATLSTGLALAAEPNPERNAYFGETHLHTSWSPDAWLFGNKLTGPADAYRYAKGEAIKHPLGFNIKIDEPMDFMGVTDHSEYVGITKMANTPGSPVSKMPETEGLIITDPSNKSQQQRAFLALVKLMGSPPVKSLITPQITGPIWKENVQIADAANQPGKFTAFCSYEWTSNVNYRNLHRNVFFRDCAKVPVAPFSALDSWHPEDLWNWMDGQRKAGNELLAISHNANLSDGWMYPTDVDSLGRPIDAAWAESRMRNERLIEIKQMKGASETHPLLSPNDEFAGYELLNILLGRPDDSGRIPKLVGSYARQALKDGLAMQDNRGYNPYKFGFGAAADAHNSAAPYRQDNFFGGHAMEDGTIETRMAGHNFAGIDVRLENPAGLTGVWAEENTRASLWDAMYRKETFGVSGPHIKLRFFGGWNIPANILEGKDWVKTAYANGVPMGGDLPGSRSGVPPNFVVWAIKDPTSGNLDRIEIVKGWTKNGQSFEKIYDVAWSGDRKPDKWSGRIPALASTVNIDNATYTNSTGAVELKAVWADPDFDPSLHAFYYARALEIETPRWTTIQAHKLDIPPPDMVPPTVQERAWASPIWYTPSAEARKAAPQGMTVAALTKQGGAMLNQAQLTALLVGKGVWVRNTVTGEQFKVFYDLDGNMSVQHVGSRATVPSLVGNVTQASYQGLSSPYKIANGKVLTTLAQAPIEETVYKLGDTYYAARNTEFGYANYEFVPNTPLFLNPLGRGETAGGAEDTHAASPPG